MPKNQKSKRAPSDDDSSSDNDEEVTILDKKEYKKFLNSLFPSKYMNDKVKAEEKKCAKKDNDSIGYYYSMGM